LPEKVPTPAAPYLGSRPQPNPSGAIESQSQHAPEGQTLMNAIIYLVGLVVIIMAILSWIGLS
jgi:hypothetical protein